MAKKSGKPTASQTITITLRVSPIGFDRKQAVIVQSMGLRRIGHSVVLVDTPETRGMIHKVRHLVQTS